MTPERQADCVRCHRRRTVSELIRVTSVRSGWWRFVCRPSLAVGGCFRSEVGSVLVDRIEPAARGLER